MVVSELILTKFQFGDAVAADINYIQCWYRDTVVFCLWCKFSTLSLMFSVTLSGLITKVHEV